MQTKQQTPTGLALLALILGGAVPIQLITLSFGYAQYVKGPDHLIDPEFPAVLARRLGSDFKKTGRGVVQGHPVCLRHAGGQAVWLLMSCVLTMRAHRLKWQATLQPLPEASGGRDGFGAACVKHIQQQGGRP